MYQIIPECAKAYQSIPECDKVYQSVSECTRVYQSVPGGAWYIAVRYFYQVCQIPSGEGEGHFDAISCRYLVALEMLKCGTEILLASY